METRRCTDCGAVLTYDGPSGEWRPSFNYGCKYQFRCTPEVTEQDRIVLDRLHRFQHALEDVYKSPLEYFSKGDK